MWFISDTHFFHRNVIAMCNRPFSSLEEMHEVMIANWNAVVKKKDIVYFLGDFSFGGVALTKEVVSRLNGIKHFCKGNHDRKAHQLIEMGFDQVFENEFITIGNHRVLLSHYPYHPVEEYASKNGLVTAQNISFAGDRRYLHKRILDDGQTWLIHGHVHTAWKQKGRQINVGVDVWGFKPVSAAQIIKLIEAGPQDLMVQNAAEYDEDL